MPLLHFDLYPIVDERFRRSFPGTTADVWDGNFT